MDEVRDGGRRNRRDDPTSASYTELLEVVQVLRGLEPPREVNDRVSVRERPAKHGDRALLGEIGRHPLDVGELLLRRTPNQPHQGLRATGSQSAHQRRAEIASGTSDDDAHHASRSPSDVAITVPIRRGANTDAGFSAGQQVSGRWRIPCMPPGGCREPDQRAR